MADVNEPRFAIVSEDFIDNLLDISITEKAIDKWSSNWQVKMNATKTKSIIFSVKNTKPYHPQLYLAGEAVEELKAHKHLGLILSSNLSWRNHILGIYSKASKRVHMLKGLKYKLNRDTLTVIYKSMIRPLLEYANSVWDGCDEYLADLLENLQYPAISYHSYWCLQRYKQNSFIG